MPEPNRSTCRSCCMPQPESPNDAAVCPKCSAAAPAGTKFCSECGASLALPTKPSAPPIAPTPQPKEELDPPAPQPAPQPVQPAAMCACGQTLPADAKFCSKCGKQVVADGPRFRVTLTSAEKGRDSSQILVEEMTIGKAADCGMVIASDDYISRRHAKLVRDGEHVFLEDIGSSNGTFLRVRRPVVLEPGDEFMVGSSLLRVDKVEP